MQRNQWQPVNESETEINCSTCKFGCRNSLNYDNVKLSHGTIINCKKAIEYSFGCNKEPRESITDGIWRCEFTCSGKVIEMPVEQAKRTYIVNRSKCKDNDKEKSKYRSIKCFI